MDKTEAYRILLTEMQSISSKSVEELNKLIGKPLEIEASSENGTHYSVSVKIIAGNNSEYIFEGNIHNNSSFKYELLEEKLIVKK